MKRHFMRIRISSNFSFEPQEKWCAVTIQHTTACLKSSRRGGALTRPRILWKQNPSPQGEKYGYFPSENPKIFDFWRASKARPYNGSGQTESPEG
jgi:hypothetical protein